MARDADRIANEWILNNPVNQRNRVRPSDSLKMFNMSFGYVTFGTYFSEGPLGFWGTWADSRQDVLGNRDYRGESGFHHSFLDEKEPGSDQVHHFGAFFSAGLTGHKFASNDHRANDVNEGNHGDVRLGDQSFRLGTYLKRNPTQLRNIGNLIRDTICNGQPVPK